MSDLQKLGLGRVVAEGLVVFIVVITLGTVGPYLLSALFGKFVIPIVWQTICSVGWLVLDVFIEHPGNQPAAFVGAILGPFLGSLLVAVLYGVARTKVNRLSRLLPITILLLSIPFVWINDLGEFKSQEHIYYISYLWAAF